jgi:hypothetical protein
MKISKNPKKVSRFFLLEIAVNEVEDLNEYTEKMSNDARIKSFSMLEETPSDVEMFRQGINYAARELQIRMDRSFNEIMGDPANVIRKKICR